MKKWIGCFLLCLLLIFGLTVSAHAEDIGTADAQALYELGLFRGVGTLEDGSPDFALNNALTRQEAVVMLVRLPGEEQTAISGSWELPFTDVAEWAKPYVGYAYENGLTKGVRIPPSAEHRPLLQPSISPLLCGRWATPPAQISRGMQHGN